jgi:uncharacterized protein YqeY
MIVDRIKHDSMVARRNGHKKEATFLVTLLSEIVMVGKNKGNRDTTDPEAILVIKKFLKGSEEILAILGVNYTDPRATDALMEQTLLQRYLPTPLTPDELRTIIVDIITTSFPEKSPKQLGNVMKMLKDKHDGKYDGGMAMVIVREILDPKS